MADDKQFVIVNGTDTIEAYTAVRSAQQEVDRHPEKVASVVEGSVASGGTTQLVHSGTIPVEVLDTATNETRTMALGLYTRVASKVTKVRAPKRRGGRRRNRGAAEEAGGAKTQVHYSTFPFWSLRFGDLLWLHRNDGPSLRSVYKRFSRFNCRDIPAGGVKSVAYMDQPARVHPDYRAADDKNLVPSQVSFGERGQSMILFTTCPITWHPKGRRHKLRTKEAKAGRRKTRKIRTDNKRRALPPPFSPISTASRVPKICPNLLQKILERLAEDNMASASLTQRCCGICPTDGDDTILHFERRISLATLAIKLLKCNLKALIESHSTHYHVGEVKRLLHAVSAPLTGGRVDNVNDYNPYVLQRLTGHADLPINYPFWALRRVYVENFVLQEDFGALVTALDEAYRRQKVAKRYRHKMKTNPKKIKYGKPADYKPSRGRNTVLTGVTGDEHDYYTGNKYGYGNWDREGNANGGYKTSAARRSGMRRKIGKIVQDRNFRPPMPKGGRFVTVPHSSSSFPSFSSWRNQDDISIYGSEGQVPAGDLVFSLYPTRRTEPETLEALEALQAQEALEEPVGEESADLIGWGTTTNVMRSGDDEVFGELVQESSEEEKEEEEEEDRQWFVF